MGISNPVRNKFLNGANRVNLKQKIYNFLRWSEKYTQTDMVYLASGGFWLTLENFVASVGAILLAIAFANLLPQEVYGQYRYILSLVSILAVPTLTGMNTAVICAVARGYERSFPLGLKTRLRWGIISTFTCLMVAGYYWFQNNPTLTLAFLIVALLMPIMQSLTIYTSFLIGKKLFNVQTKYKIITEALTIAVFVPVLFLTNNILLILLIYFSLPIIIHLVFLKITLKKYPPNEKIDPQTISYGKHLSLMTIVNPIASHLDKILIWYFLGPIEVAIYSFATIPPQQIINSFKIVPSLALPKLSSYSISSKFKKAIFKKTAKIILLAVPIVFSYIILAPIIYKLVFPHYLDSVLYSQFFALSILFAPAQFLLGAFFTAQVKKKELYTLTLISPPLQIVLFLLLLPFYGIWGIISAIIIVHLINLTLALILLKRA